MDKLSFLLAMYSSGFVLMCWAEQKKWLLGTIAVWLAINMVIVPVLSGVMGIPLFAWGKDVNMPYFYMFLASVGVFAGYWRKSVASSFWQLQGMSPLASLFAVSGALLVAAYVVLLVLVGWQFPNGLSPYVLPVMVQMYVFDPLYWISMQVVVMAIFYVHRTVLEQKPANLFSGKQLQAGFLVCLLLQVSYVVAELTKMTP